MKSFIFGGDTGKTQDDLSDQRKRLAYAMLQQGMDTSPVQSPWQGAARLAQALMGGLAIRQQDEERQASAQRLSDTVPSRQEAPLPLDAPALKRIDSAGADASGTSAQRSAPSPQAVSKTVAPAAGPVSALATVPAVDHQQAVPTSPAPFTSGTRTTSAGVKWSTELK